MLKVYLNEVQDQKNRIEHLIEEERKRQYLQHEEILHLKNENQELVRASRKQSEINFEDSKNFGYDSNLRANLGGLPTVTMPKKPSVPHMSSTAAKINPLSTQSMDNEEKLREIMSQLEQIDPRRHINK